MQAKKAPKKAVVKEYAVVKARYAGIHAGPLAIQAIEGPYEILEDHLLDRDAARELARDLESQLNPTGDRAAGVHVFYTNRADQYRPAPLRHSEYEIHASFAYRDSPIVISLDGVRRAPSAKKDFKDYVKRVREPNRPTSRLRGGLWDAELVRKDFYKGKPAGGETILRLADLDAK
ncbi:hypothetical protein SEA_LILMAC1015_78 [Arthrobacter phage Lilmac1015]|uniref:Uncharacterized protein n=1 Tax=Arthrobacter phage Lilmac1015 TaxID=2912653 RepID=A0AA49BNR0_9CAUD|nr:hypothetical protein SEA_LILMAC1015_78 [Arthrobacter phage Lilmac1015]